MKVEVESNTACRSVLHFSVIDTGPGIPQRKQKVIFEAFAQSDSSMTRKYGGTGLGLSISSRLVGLMAGKLWVESQPGQRQHLSFPACLLACKRQPRHKPAPVNLEMLRDLSVLIVDDNATNRTILRETLTGWHMKADEAEGGKPGHGADARGAKLPDMPIAWSCWTRRCRTWMDSKWQR